MDLIGRHEIRRLSWSSATASDIMEAGRRRHHVAGLVELDVTAARGRIRGIRERTGESVSFTGWLAGCLGRALAEHRALNAHRHGRARVVVFDDVDVTIIVERDAGGTRRPLPFVLRHANEKTVLEISREVRAVQAAPIGEDEMVMGGGRWTRWLARLPRVARFYALVPSPIRLLFWKALSRDAFAAKRIMGTAGITAVGMMGHLSGWPLTVGVHTVDLAIGGIVEKPRVVAGRMEPREMLAVTILVDHDIVDGAPATRFVSRLAELVESAHGLEPLAAADPAGR
ncbi:MAG: 2-oxo acid dehydrogenase subunit E2 [Deltaproteobacteria bacterium]|nr:2-oxo acid dehydrogenase subunit E2 [Deltaproteobacteria bacterium]